MKSARGPFVVKPAVSAGGQSTALYVRNVDSAVDHVHRPQSTGTTVMVRPHLEAVAGALGRGVASTSRPRPAVDRHAGARGPKRALSENCLNELTGRGRPATCAALKTLDRLVWAGTRRRVSAAVDRVPASWRHASPCGAFRTYVAVVAVGGYCVRSEDRIVRATLPWDPSPTTMATKSGPTGTMTVTVWSVEELSNSLPTPNWRVACWTCPKVAG